MRWYQFSLRRLLFFMAMVAVLLRLYVPGHTVVHYQPLVEGTKPGQAWAGNGLDMQFRWCPAGEFTMGSPADEKDREDNEGPVQVTLSRGFWIGKYEVTQGDWKRVMGSEPWRVTPFVKKGDYFPATYVSYDEAIVYCQKLTAQERAEGRLPTCWEYRLPTEAQWEYACRSGSAKRYCFGDKEARLDEFAWFDKNALNAGDDFAHEVGLKRPNAWVCATCTETSGNGAATGIHLRSREELIRKLLRSSRTACTVAGAGTTPPAFAGRRTVTSTRRSSTT